jgi:hypothetical protein
VSQLILMADAAPPAPLELNLMKDLSELLCREYPGYAWMVGINQALVDIRLVSVVGSFGYTLHLTKFYSASERDDAVKRAGGELLERYRLRRGHLNESELLSLRKDFAGRHIVER